MDITFKEEEIKDEILVEFNKVCSGATEVFIALIAHASERTKVARITIRTISRITGFSIAKVVRVLNRLKETGFIEAPYEGYQGRKQIYKLKVLFAK